MTRILIVIAIALLSFNFSTVIAQEVDLSAIGEPAGAISPEPFLSIAQAPASAHQKDQTTRIFQLESDNLNTIVQVLQQLVPSAKAAVDERSNSLIVMCEQDQLIRIEELIRTLDSDAPGKPPSLSNNVAYRVYAIEAPVELQTQKQLRQEFFVQLSIPGENVITNLPQLEQSLDGVFMIEKLECNFSGEFESRSPSSPDAGSADAGKKKEPRVYSEIMIQGQASSPAVLQELIKTIEESIGAKVDVKSMQFIARHTDETMQSSKEDNRFYQRLEEMLEETESDSASSPLKSLKKTLSNILGDDLRVYGYWFGASSLPGVCKVPIGPWVLEIQSQKTDDHVIYRMGMMGMGGYGMPGGMGDYGMGGMDGSSDKSKGAGGGMGGSGSNKGMSGGMMGGMGGMGMGMGMKPSPSSNEFMLEITLTENDKTILTNSVNARLGRPVIVGYTRKLIDLDATGALVIIPESELPAD